MRLLRTPRRGFNHVFRAAQLELELAEGGPPPQGGAPGPFGRSFTPHMLWVEWSRERGWAPPRIRPLRDLHLHPATCGLHYGITVFEGLKAFGGPDGRIRLFRPELNMERMERSAQRLCLPPFDRGELLECIRALVRADGAWVPRGGGDSLYIRPVLLGTDPVLGLAPPGRALLFVLLCRVGPYFPGEQLSPVRLLADPRHCRAWPGGTGHCKIGANYGPTLALQREAQARGCQQVLWLHGPRRLLTEVGTMNLFILWHRQDGELELVTPPLDGLILPGVTRQSLLDLAREWGEFRVREEPVPLDSVLAALAEGRLREMFGCGTACAVCPVGGIVYEDKLHPVPTMEHGAELTQRFLRALTDIQYGRVPSPWAQIL